MKKISCILFCFIFYSGVFSQAVNIDFEASSPGSYTTSNSVNGWTISSQTASCNSTTSWIPGSQEFSIVTTPILNLPYLGNLGHSYLGGYNIAQLNNLTANASKTKLSQNFSVTPSNQLLAICYAGLFEGGSSSESCCASSAFTIQLKNSSGSVISCYSVSAISNGPGCPNGGPGYSVTSVGGNPATWSNWQVNYFDLSPFLNTSITLEVIVNDCVNNDHLGTLFFDASLTSQNWPWFNNGLLQISSYPSVCGFCPGSNVAQIQAPLGFSYYQWISPFTGTIASPQGNMSNLIITNPIANSIYTVNLYTTGGCMFTSTYALVYTNVSIGAVGSNSTCIGGNGGSATVVANGSSSGYTYSWLNSTSSVVSTASTVSNLSPGTYTVNVSAAGSASSTCGNASITATIGVAPPSIISIVKPFCNSEAYLCGGIGSNYQWYANSTSVSASSGGTNSCYSYTGAINGGTIGVSYNNQYGCRDSVKFTLVSVSPGSIAISSNPMVCPSSSNGAVTLTLQPAQGVPVGFNSFSVVSTGTTTTYSSSLSPTSQNTFTANNLLGGGTYSASVFDGACKYSLNFSVNTVNFNYTLNPSNSPTLCNGNPLGVTVTFTSPPSLNQYTYSWTPSTFLTGTNTINAIIVPTLSSGTLSTIVYTVVVTPSLVNCPLTKTMAVSFAYPQTPTIVPIPTLCANATSYSINVNPPGGTFINGTSNSINSSGILSPTLASLGLNTFTYANSIGTCVAKTSSSFVIIGPTLNITAINNTSVFCGESVTLSASGANTYSWSNAALTSSITVTPLNTSTYYVTGTNTTSLCSKISSVQITVLPSATLNLFMTGSNTVCSGNSNTLIAFGANTYTWSNGSVGPNLIVSPTVTSNYTVTGTAANGCTNIALTTQTVLLNPTLTISGNYTICPGRESFLAAYGASTYTWSNGSQSQFLTLSPSETTTYSVIGIDYQGCSSTKTVTIVVEGCVGVNEFYSTDLEIKIYPNPSSGNVFLETEHSVQISIFNDLGKLISQKEFEKGNHSIDLSDYNSGVYLLKISDAYSQKVLKLLKTD